MSILPASNIINVTVTDTPSGLTTKNVNSLALFTNESPSGSAPYGIYISAAQVAADYGTDSITSEMANAVFSQSPNILAGDGRLVIIPMLSAVSATPGNFVTTNISANLSSFVAVTHGDLKVTINGTVNNLSNVNLTNCNTLADVAAVLQGYLIDVTVTATTTVMTFVSKKVGTSSAVLLGTVSGGSGTDLSGSGYLNESAGTPGTGTNSSGETLLAAIARTTGAVGFVGVMTNLNIEDAVLTTTAAGIQAQDLMFLHHFASAQDIAGFATSNSAASNTRTRPLLYTPGLAAANLMKAAYAGRAFSTDFTGSRTATTMNLKSLATVDPDLGITETMYVNANIAGIDLYVDYDGVPSVYSTGGNDYFDNPYADLALKFALVSAGFNYLRTTNTKIPQTESGMTGLKSVYESVMEAFVTNGSLAPGQWTSADTFGNQQIFLNNITNRGYYVYSQPIAQQNVSDRQNRKAPLCQIAAKRAGAIQTSDVLVLINN